MKLNPYHDRRTGQFTTAEGAGEATGARSYPIADTGADKYSVDLSQEERSGGHTIDRHVDRSDDSLLAEASAPVREDLFFSYYRAVGSFVSLSDANNLVNRVLESNTALVDAVANGSLDDDWLEVRFGYPTGREAVVLDASGEPKIRPTYYVGVKIVHDANSPRGYTVRTAYPLNRLPGETRL